MRYCFDLLPFFDEVKTINIGGGLGVAYKDNEEVTDPHTFCDSALRIRDEYAERLKREINICIEPGRYVVADSAVLLCTVTATKKTSLKKFIGTDTGFNHLIRPALYGSHH
jgi:diaminopimelate decarboxylase